MEVDTSRLKHAMTRSHRSSSPFHPNIFASCSADGTVKLWHDNVLFVFSYHRVRHCFDVHIHCSFVHRQCLMRFDLCSSVNDIGWSPYTSTTFAAASVDGRVYIFDIHANKLEPICEQRVTHETAMKCTKMAFNPVHPILLVGDDRFDEHLQTTIRMNSSFCLIKWLVNVLEIVAESTKKSESIRMIVLYCFNQRSIMFMYVLDS
jgi:WD40 repeat protein